MANFTVMGWNQLVKMVSGAGTPTTVPVTDYNVGINQAPDVPDLVSGKSDRYVFSLGKIEVQGTINAPLTSLVGDTLVANAIGLAEDPSLYITCQTSAYGYFSITGARVNRLTVSANEGEPINISAEIWGVGDWSGSSAPTSRLVDQEVTTAQAGYILEGFAPSEIAQQVYQIPMFDQVTGAENLLPVTNGVVTSVEIVIDNKLQRNYVLGSTQGLDAYSISAGQRLVTGRVSWQSSATGYFDFITGAGTGTATNLVNFADVFSINLAAGRLLFGATPPPVNVNKLVGEADFTVLTDKPGSFVVS